MSDEAARSVMDHARMEFMEGKGKQFNHCEIFVLSLRRSVVLLLRRSIAPLLCRSAAHRPGVPSLC